MAVIVNTRIDTREIEQLISKMNAGRAAIAIARGLTDSIKVGRTQAVKGVRERYNIKLFEINKKGMMRVTGARKGELSASLYANVSNSIPLTSFTGTRGDNQAIQRKRVKGQIETTAKRGGRHFKSITRSKPRQKVSVEVIKGKRITLDEAFLARTPITGHIGVFGRSFNSKGYDGSGNFRKRHKRVRKKGPDLPIAQLTSFTLHKSLSNKFVEKKVVRRMESNLPMRVTFWLKRELKIV